MKKEKPCKFAHFFTSEVSDAEKNSLQNSLSTDPEI